MLQLIVAGLTVDAQYALVALGIHLVLRATRVGFASCAPATGSSTCAYVLEGGAVALEGTAAELAADDRVRAIYLGGATDES